MADSSCVPEGCNKLAPGDNPGLEKPEASAPEGAREMSKVISIYIRKQKANTKVRVRCPESLRLSPTPPGWIVFPILYPGLSPGANFSCPSGTKDVSVVTCSLDFRLMAEMPPTSESMQHRY